MKKILPFLLCLAAALSCRPGHAPLACQAPAFLVPGDTVALISPAYATGMENVEGAAAILREWGFVPVVGPNVGKTYRGLYAGTPRERMDDLAWALENPSVKAILCNRGGYGTVQMIGKMPAGIFSAHPKWLVGFSDITTLHAMETCAGVMSIHGTMGSLIHASAGEGPSSTLLRDLLTGTVPQYSVPAHPFNRPGKASGVLVGGNLSTFAPVMGTDADPTRGKDFILFLEEVEENLQHIDRLFQILLLNGILEHCKGIVLGEFTDCEANLDYQGAEELIVSYLDGTDIPVCCGFPAGHDEVNLPLVMGAETTLEVTPSGASLTFGLAGASEPVETSVFTRRDESSSEL